MPARRDAKTGIVTREQWFKDGQSHRSDGPALIKRDAKTGIVTSELWYKDGDRIEPPQPAKARPTAPSAQKLVP
jgi:hypothetical protein